MEQPLTLFHITHWKAGSQWVASVLRESLQPQRYINPSPEREHLLNSPIQPGKFYPASYIDYPEFEATLFPTVSEARSNRIKQENMTNFVNNMYPVKTFLVLRDIRDTMVSLYFSMRYSHAELGSDFIKSTRSLLNSVNLDEGFRFLMRSGGIPYIAKIQSSWFSRNDVLVIKYEELIANELLYFQNILDFAELHVPAEKLAEIIKGHSFEGQTGRNKGVEDKNAHLRKGIAGDWKNYLSAEIKEEFKNTYGELLIATGYERDKSW